jgi:hypothetical protein
VAQFATRGHGRGAHERTATANQRRDRAPRTRARYRARGALDPVAEHRHALPHQRHPGHDLYLIQSFEQVQGLFEQTNSSSLGARVDYEIRDSMN